MPKAFVGTSGWNYKHWHGGEFYRALLEDTAMTGVQVKQRSNIGAVRFHATSNVREKLRAHG
jgi:hypothetical protein